MAGLAIVSLLTLPSCATLRVLLLPGPTPSGAAARAAGGAAAPSALVQAMLCGAAVVLGQDGFSTARLGDRVMANRRLELAGHHIRVLAARYEVIPETTHEGPSVLRFVLAVDGETLTVKLFSAGFSIGAAESIRLEGGLLGAARGASRSPVCQAD